MTLPATIFSNTGYREWRAAKLDGYPNRADDLCVDIGSLEQPGSSAMAKIRLNCVRANMAVYTCHDAAADRAAVRNFAELFGLRRLDHHLCANEDGVSELTVAQGDRRAGYAPYSASSLSWHTDGYYNDASRQIHAVVLHCVRDAKKGGENALLDPEIAYIRLRDANPAFIEALTHPTCMTIPANIENGREIRPEISGPVLSFDGPGGALHMRFSARKRNIRWREDPATTAATQFLAELLADDAGPVLRYRLGPGQGLISNNVLHDRTAFEDTPDHKRLLYRARFFDRIEPS